MSLPERIPWLSLICKWELKARKGITLVQLIKNVNAVVFVWNSPAALEHYLNFVGYFGIKGLEGHFYYESEGVLNESENPFIRIYHRIDYFEWNERIDTGLIWG